MANSTKRSRSRKANLPPKPYKDFPLTPHPLGYWVKTIRSKHHRFGRWGRIVNGKMERLPGDGWQEALDLYKAQADDLHAGRTPSNPSDSQLRTVRHLCNCYLTVKQELLNTREITPRTFQGYKSIADRLVSVLGKSKLVEDISTSDLRKLRSEMAKTLGPVALSNHIQGVRSVFKFAYDEGLIEKPVRYGQSFNKPSKKTLRKNRAEKGKRMFEAADIRRIIDAAGQPLKAMFLLGINCGFGNTDVATLTISAVNLETGWVTFPRPKTGIERRCPLWPETTQALQEAIECRPLTKDDANRDLCFVTRKGNCWVKSKTGSSDDAVTKETAKLLKELGLHRRGLGFYALRHTFQTIGEEAGETATRHIMGHTDDSMSAVYRERISDERLRAVTEHVRSWLFGIGATGDAPENAEPIALRIVG